MCAHAIKENEQDEYEGSYESARLPGVNGHEDGEETDDDGDSPVAGLHTLLADLGAEPLGIGHGDIGFINGFLKDVSAEEIKHGSIVVASGYIDWFCRGWFLLGVQKGGDEIPEFHSSSLVFDGAKVVFSA